MRLGPTAQLGRTNARKPVGDSAHVPTSCPQLPTSQNALWVNNYYAFEQVGGVSD